MKEKKSEITIVGPGGNTLLTLHTYTHTYYIF